MKKQLLALCLLLCMVAGCGEKTENAALAETQSKVQPVYLPKPTVNRLRALSNEDSTEAGVYKILSSPWGSYETVYYFDAATATQRPLCGIENCGHKEESCEAVLDFNSNGSIFVEDETVYIFTAKRVGDHNELQLDCCSLNGENHRTLWAFTTAELSAMFDDGIYTGTNTKGVFYDGNRLYLPLFENRQEGNSRNIMLCCEPQTGQWYREDFFENLQQQSGVSLEKLYVEQNKTCQDNFVVRVDQGEKYVCYLADKAGNIGQKMPEFYQKKRRGGNER